jgi:hypothetical protein
MTEKAFACTLPAVLSHSVTMPDLHDLSGPR